MRPQKPPQFVLGSTLIKKPKGSWSKRFVGTQVLGSWLIDCPVLLFQWLAMFGRNVTSLEFPIPAKTTRRLWKKPKLASRGLPTMFFCFCIQWHPHQVLPGKAPPPATSLSDEQRSAGHLAFAGAMLLGGGGGMWSSPGPLMILMEVALGLPRNRWNRWFHQQDIPFFIKRWERSLQLGFFPWTFTGAPSVCWRAQHILRFRCEFWIILGVSGNEYTAKCLFTKEDNDKPQLFILGVPESP